jgi:hypothetical protein
MRTSTRTLGPIVRIFVPFRSLQRFGGSGSLWSAKVPVFKASPSFGMATPAGLEPATNSLEGAWSRNDFNARADIFTFRAPFDAIAEFRFVGMPDALPAADGLRTSSLLGGTSRCPKLIGVDPDARIHRIHATSIEDGRYRARSPSKIFRSGASSSLDRWGSSRRHWSKIRTTAIAFEARTRRHSSQPESGDLGSVQSYSHGVRLYYSFRPQVIGPSDKLAAHFETSRIRERSISGPSM